MQHKLSSGVTTGMDLGKGHGATAARTGNPGKHPQEIVDVMNIVSEIKSVAQSMGMVSKHVQAACIRANSRDGDCK